MPRRPVTASALARRTLLAGLAATALCSGASALARDAAGAASPRATSLLVVTLDTTRAGHLGAYGAPAGISPVLDRLARRGTVFSAAATSAPVTLPSHATIFTGLYPFHHGVRNNTEYRLSDAQTTLAEILSGAGFETAAFVSAFVLEDRYGLSQGFGTYDDRVGGARGSAFESANLERPSADVTDAAIAWLRQRSASGRFFAWVHYYAPHTPYEPPVPERDLFPRDLYGGEIASTDAQVGRLLATLAARGLEERTLVVVVADHGESLGEHGELTHSVFLYEGVMQVPLIAGGAGWPLPAGPSDRLAGTVDLLPTLLSALSLPVPAKLDGRSLLEPAPAAARAIYLESLVPYLEFGWAPLVALRGPGGKAISAPRAEAYDLASDPAEEHPLDGRARPRDLAALESQLGAILPRALAELDLAGDAPAVDDATRASLEALGYVSGAGAADPAAELADPKDMIFIATAIVETNALMAEGKLPEALEVIQGAAAASPGDRSVLQLLGKVCLRMGRFAEAEEAFRAFREIRPKADVSVLLAQLLIMRRRWDEAAALLDEAERLDPRHGGTYIARGDMQAARGDIAGARASYLRAGEVDPQRAAGAMKARLERLVEGARDGSSPGR